MNSRMKKLHWLLHGEEGEQRDENGHHIAHLVNGKQHIAFGHLLDQEQTDRELDIMGLDDELDDWTGFTVNDDQAHELFEVDVEDAYSGACISFSGDELDALDDTRWAIVLSMCYQMGSVTKFPSFINAVKMEDWNRAADEMLWSNGLKKQRRSAWYKETPARCQRAADAMISGVLEGFEPQSAVLQENESQDKLLASVSNKDLFAEVLRRIGE